MFCGNCGHQFADGAAFCPECGAPVNAQQAPVYQAPVYDAAPVSVAPMNRKEYWKAADKKTRSSIITAAVFCYVSAAVTLIGAIAVGNWFALLDVMLILGFGLVVHLTKRPWAASILLAYGIFNCIYMSISLATFAGWLPLAAGIDALIGTLRFQKGYKAQLK